ncbi:polyprenyl synthetase family protein [Streptomyces alanosinicus]|uniref:Polyprenyl synthetase n=1 Tax=Streptomyces alanosinicus TaxID=68171 RepID=A0A918YU28_9ACTN|nr:polyprenyl synthetase family protein [Streptomyces alanosinicus]GHE16094.1 polyprenyl synthetase [Streptomyces alanosinicus]
MTVEITADVHERLAGYRDRFEPLFARYFDTLAQQQLPHSSFVPEALELVRDMSLRGGKRLRVALLYEAARLVTPDPVEGLEEAALSIELLQTHGLIHDDIVDDSPVRRGARSVYYAYRDRYPDREQTALGLAVLAGDLAAFWSVQVLLCAPVSRELCQAMAAVQATAGADTVVGQVLDLERDFGPLPDREVLDAVSEYKSARYSVLAPLQLGLLAAGADPAGHHEELARYARLVGVSGQLRDDYLDLFADTATVGKPTGSDLRAGRRSYAVCALLGATAGRDRELVEAALADPDCPPEMVEQVQGIARHHGVDRQLRADSRRIAQDAAAVAAGWRGRWRADAVEFFEHLPLWGAQRIS